MAVQLAQLNIALPSEPLDSVLLADFVAALEPVNAAADAAPGFVWRLQTDAGDATGITALGDDRLIVNMSVWESTESLRGFVYGSRIHRDVLRRKREWFERLGEAHVVLWWVAAGQIPTIGEAERRLALLRAQGPSPAGFTFRRYYAAPGTDPSAAPAYERTQLVTDDRALCPAG
jgi:hypothetical protein